MKFRTAILSLVVAPWLALLAAAQANMPGTFVPTLIAQVSSGTPLSCTGGTVTTSGVYRIHTFTSNGTLTCTGGGSANYLVVAGGGGGASGTGGGGGSGGVLAGTATLSSGSYTITVGSGGSAGASGAANNGGNGNDSLFDGLDAVGGGGGGKASGSGL